MSKYELRNNARNVPFPHRTERWRTAASFRHKKKVVQDHHHAIEPTLSVLGVGEERYVQEEWWRWNIHWEDTTRMGGRRR